MRIFAEMFFCEALELRLPCLKPFPQLYSLQLHKLGGVAQDVVDSQVAESMRVVDLMDPYAFAFESPDALLPDDFPVRLLPYTVNADNNDSASESPDSSSSASEHESLLSSLSDVEIQPCMQDRPGVQEELLYSPTSPAHFPELVEMPSGSTAFPGATLGWVPKNKIRMPKNK